MAKVFRERIMLEIDVVCIGGTLEGLEGEDSGVVGLVRVMLT